MLKSLLLADNEETIKKKFLAVTIGRFFIYPLYLSLTTFFCDLNNCEIFARFNHPYFFIYSKTFLFFAFNFAIVFFLHNQAIKKQRNGFLTAFISINSIGLLFTIFFFLRSLIGANDPNFLAYFKENILEFVFVDVILIPLWLYFALKVRRLNEEIQQMDALLKINPNKLSSIPFSKES